MPAFLSRLWSMMREGDWQEDFSDKFVEYFDRMLRENQLQGICSKIRVADWSLFGNLRDKRIVGKTGTPDNLVNHSTLLDRLSQLKEEIPFYVFLAGQAEIVEPMKKRPSINVKLLKIAGRAFVKMLVYCFQFREIQGAWTEATKEGS